MNKNMSKSSNNLHRLKGGHISSADSHKPRVRFARLIFWLFLKITDILITKDVVNS